MPEKYPDGRFVLSLRRHEPDQVPDRLIDQGSGPSHLSRAMRHPLELRLVLADQSGFGKHFVSTYWSLDQASNTSSKTF